MPQNILGLVYTHDNNTLFLATRDYAHAFQAIGYNAAVVDLATSDGVGLLSDTLRRDQTAFCFGLQGVGSNLKRGAANLWEDAKIPFLGLHYDNPCYNMYNHGNASRWVANIYFAESFLDIRQRYIDGDQINSSLPFRITQPPNPALYGVTAAADIAAFPFAGRTIKYLYLKSGEKLDEYASYFDSLPANLREGVWQIVKQAQINPNMVICDLVKNLLTSSGYDLHAHHAQFWAVVQSLDYYLRRKRAIDMVEWLKIQEGAVIVGNGWDFIDRTNAGAEFRPAMPLEDAMNLYPQAQFIVNTSPYGADIIHERIIFGLLHNCCVISDSNAWWDKNFSDVPAFLRLDFNQSLDDQIKPFVANDAATRAATGREPAVSFFAPQDNYAHIVACAEKVRAFAKL